MRCAAWRATASNYGPLRLWGSAAFVVGALACGLLVDVIAAEAPDLGDRVGGGARRCRQPRAAAAGQPEDRPAAPAHGATRACCAIPAFSPSSPASALIQGSHAAYYTFASITWQQSGLGGLTIAGLWALGVLAEIVVFALSPRFTLQPALLVVIGGAQRRRALADHGAGAADRGARRRAAGARPDLRADPGRHHGPAGAPCARPCDGAGAGLSRRLHRHRHLDRVDLVRRDLRPLRAGRLLRDGGDGAVRRPS